MNKSDRNHSSHITLGQRSRRSAAASTLRSPTGMSELYRTRSEAHGSVSTRSADLSQRVGKVEEGITDVNGKLDKILERFTANSVTSTPRPTCTRPQPAPTSYLDFETELRRAEPQFHADKGKDQIRDFFVQRVIPRPYMFIEGVGLHSQKDKTVYRDKMSYNEYVLGFTNMLTDPRGYPSQDWPHLIEHLNQVTCDAISRPWHHVRAWSDHIFSRVESGSLSWDDRSDIQFLRMRLSLAPPTDRQTTQNHTQHDAPKQVVCADFNARRCKHRASHVEAGIAFLHNCAWCYAALGNKNPHTVIQCENKLRFQAERQGQQNPMPPPATRQAPHTYPFPNQHLQQNQQQFQPTKRPVFTAAVVNPTMPPRPKNDQ